MRIRASASTFTVAFLATQLLLGGAALGAEANLESEFIELVRQAAALDREPFPRPEEAPKLHALLVQLEEKILYLQNMDGAQPMAFLASQLNLMHAQIEQLRRGREEQLRKKVKLLDDIADLQKEVAARPNEAKQKQLDELRQKVEGDHLPRMPVTVYWLLVRGVTGFGKDSAIAELSEIMSKHIKDRVAHDIMFGLQGNHAPALVDLHKYVMERGGPELAIMSAEQLGQIKDQRAIDVLVTGLEQHKHSRPVVLAIGTALTRLTGQPHGEDAVLWRDWWKANEQSPMELDEAGHFVKVGEAVESIAEVRVIDSKVLVLTQTCPKNNSPPFDRLEDICMMNKLKFDLMQKEEFNKTPPDLTQYSAILINCTQYRTHCHGANCAGSSAAGFRLFKCTGPGPHDPQSHSLNDASLKLIEKYVADGGYLFTEDWGLIEVTGKLYPALITAWPTDLESSSKFLREMDVDVNPVPGATSHHLLRGVYQFHTVDAKEAEIAAGGTDSSVRVGDLLHKWHIDNESPAMIVGDRDMVTVLLASNSVAAHTGTDGACAVTFFPGRGKGSPDSPFMVDAASDSRVKAGGRVLHILSHLTKQSNLNDDRAIKRLLLNFMDEAALSWDANQR